VQRLQGLGVVPVVEVAAIPFQLQPSCRSALVVRSISRPGRQVAKIIRGQIREQRQVPCWSARCDARPRPPDAPERCPAAANGRSGPTKVSKNAQVSAGNGAEKAKFGQRRQMRASRRVERAAHPPGERRSEASHSNSSGPATASAAGLATANRPSAVTTGERGGDSHHPVKGDRGLGAAGDPGRPTRSIRASAGG
jgi:hypothetical protein